MKIRPLLIAFGLLLPITPLPAQDDPKPEAKPAAAEAAAEPKKPAVQQISETEFELGKIRFDAKTREVRIPALVNATLDNDIIEYVLVHEGGKTHESLFKTTVSPMDLQVVLKLLSFKTGKGSLFDGLYPPGELPVPEAAGDALDVLVIWPGSDENPVTNLIRDHSLDGPMRRAPWIYNGSEIVEGKFQAEMEGSIVSLYLDSLAMFNVGDPLAGDDENWYPISKSIPAYETPVTVILRPAAADPKN